MQNKEKILLSLATCFDNLEESYVLIELIKNIHNEDRRIDIPQNTAISKIKKSIETVLDIQTFIKNG